jgi:hypothetical protein
MESLQLSKCKQIWLTELLRVKLTKIQKDCLWIWVSHNSHLINVRYFELLMAMAVESNSGVDK